MPCSPTSRPISESVLEVDYIMGWRVKSEILTRPWSYMDFRSGWLRLEPGETKNDEGHQFPLTPICGPSWSASGSKP